jgi:hypothetical protein
MGMAVHVVSEERLQNVVAEKESGYPLTAREALTARESLSAGAKGVQERLVTDRMAGG